MARPIVLGNGELHVGLNKYGLVHDFYYPYVGLENHAAGASLRHKIGIWVNGQISWLDEDPDWTFSFHYPHTALIGHTLARNDRLQIMLEFDDTVDSEMSIFMRNVHVINHAPFAREIRLFMHQAYAIGDSRSNTDTAQYLPDSDAILHYRGRRAFVIGGTHNGRRFDQYTIGLFGIENHEGSYKDAEDGILSFNNVEHGRVDSILGFTLQVRPMSSERVHYWVSAGMSIREALYMHKQMQDDGLSKRLHNTADWWHKWLQPGLAIAERLPKPYQETFIDSMMIMKSQMDKRGAVMASTDSTMLNYSRDAYAYSWPRDGAFALWPFIRMGYSDEPYRFFEFCRRGMHPGGYLLHKYTADGAPGSSWHPYVHGSITAPPIQEDETALTVFMFAQFYQAQQDGTLIKDFYNSMIVPMAEFLSEYIEPATGLPKPSYDLWEQTFSTSTYTTATVYAALQAASELATVAGDSEHAVKWRTASDDIKAAAHKHLFNEERKTFRRGLIFIDDQLHYDNVLDVSSIFGAFLFGLYDTDSAELQASIATMRDTFVLIDDEPGIPRQENDAYRRSDPTITGNWWHITTLWHAQYMIDQGDEESARNVLDWVTSHALRTGVLAEQVDPLSDQSVAPAPLTWSHAEYLSTLLDLLEKKR